MDELLTIDEVARYCRVHQATVRRHIAAGRLRSVRVGRSLRVRREDLDRFVGRPEDERDPDMLALANAKPFSKDDALWKLVGLFDDPDSAWVSSDKKRALADAYMPKR